jgi:hypothetical protein
MKRNQDKGGLFGKIWRGGVLLSVLGLGIALFAGAFSMHSEDQAVVADAGWGGEATSALVQGAIRISPIALANACGLGASSCFKCHNGTRAAKANMDPVKSPWHAQHGKVNNSCVGCHKGNSRLMKEEMAHAKMIAKPRDNSAGVCASCHSGDLSKVQGAYHATPGAK